MKRTQLLLCLALLFCGKMGFCQDPNIIFFIVDDQGWNGTSQEMIQNDASSKTDYYVTPGVEALADSGMVFSRAYASAPKCSPSRNSILSGQTTAKRGFTNTTSQLDSTHVILSPVSDMNINQPLTTITELIKANSANYITGHFGKWHLGSAGPSNHGFDRGDGNTGNSDGDQGGLIQTDPKRMYQISDSALAVVNDAVAGGKSFYLQLSHYAVHSPEEATQASIDSFANTGIRPVGTVHDDEDFGAMTEDLDHALEYLLDSLETLGVMDNTYIIYTSDNGASYRVSSNYPLSYGKMHLSEGGIRVPLIVTGPGVPQGTYSTEPVVGYDFYPTIVQWIFSNTSNVPTAVEGTSLADHISTGGATPLNRIIPIIHHSPHYDQDTMKHPHSSIMIDSLKLLVDYETGDFNMYNVETDLDESDDLQLTHPDLFDSLVLELRDYLKGVTAGMPRLNPIYPTNLGPATDLDSDGLNDEWEFREMLTYHYGYNDDPDGDGYINGVEEINNTDPYVADPVKLQEEGEKEFKVFPNPSNGNVSVEGLAEDAELILYNGIGRSYSITHSNGNLDLSEYAKGVYFLRILKNNQIIGVEQLILK